MRGRLDLVNNNNYDNTVYEFKIKPQREVYYSEDTCWGVYRFFTLDSIPECEDVSDPFMNNDSDNKPVYSGSLVGNVQRLLINTEYHVRAVLVYNNKYKKYDYKPLSVTSEVPRSQKDQQTFLRAIVTELQADNILTEYPNVVDDVVHNREIDYNRIKGIGENTWSRIKNKILDNYVLSDIISLLAPLGITSLMISKLLEKEPNPVLLKQKLLSNPYAMTECDGLGFKRVDSMALKINPDLKESRYRTVEYIKHFFNSLGEDEGSTYTTLKKLDEAIIDNIFECYDIYQNIIQENRENETLLCLIDDENECEEIEQMGVTKNVKKTYVCLKSRLNQELKIINMLKSLDIADSPLNIDVEKGIKEAEEKQGFLYTDEQRENIRNICKHNVSFVSGLAGCGKTTLVRGVLLTYSLGKNIVSCCALSAKAAQRMRDATGFDAQTIHSLLGYGKEGFTFKEDNPLYTNVVVVDEASMVNVPIFYALLSALRSGTRIIIVGDDGQLPPIGYGNTFHDMLNCDLFYRCKLTKIMRQAEKSGIISDSIKIRDNKNPLDIPKLKVVTGELQDMTYMFRDNRDGMRDLAIDLYMKSIEKDGVDNTIIVTPCKQDRVNSTFEINKIIQDKLIPKTVENMVSGNKEFRIGAKVIQRKNDREKGILNGDIGYVIDIIADRNNKMLVVDFNSHIVKLKQGDLNSLELAYALTCHVTQGSGYKNVIVLIDMTHYKLLDSCLLYTAITRAEKKCLLIAEPKAFTQCITHKASNRSTITDLLIKNGLIAKYLDSKILK